jgi:hypothetical protein
VRDRRALAAAILLLILAAAALIRRPCARTQPWLDEIWSIGLARRAASAATVFRGLHDDNNNPLNTLYLRLVPAGAPFAEYRLLSLGAGLLTVALLGWDPEDRARGLVAAALAAVSTHMVLYATEARGYALMALFALLCWRLLRPPEEPSRPRAAAFAACALLAFLSHPTFVYVYAAFFLWAWVKLPPSDRLRGLLALFAFPTAAFGLYEALQYPLTIDGAASYGLGPILARTLSLWSGAPENAAAALAGGAALVALIAWELARLRRKRPGEFVFFAALFAGALAFAALFPFPFERHFYACLPFALLLAAGALTRLYRAGGAGRVAALALALAFAAGNGARDRALAAAGRGHYQEAVARMAAETRGDVVTVGSDHDARNRMVLEFYAARSGAAKRFSYVPAEARGSSRPEWMLMHGFYTDPRLAPVALTYPGAGASYRLVEVFPYAGLSGWTWSLYRREAPPSGT